MAKPTTKIPIEFGDDLYAWVRALAYSQRRSMADVVREAIREFRAVNDPQMKLPMETRPSRGGRRLKDRAS
jgi:Arc/MetJ-type ribon-helix-helix transcriptional regulator